MNKEDIDFLISIQDLEQPDFDNSCLERENQRLNKEIERLNNIIDELEKELKEGSFDVYFCSTSSQKTFKSNEIIIKAMILDKLKELKEGK